MTTATDINTFATAARARKAFMLSDWLVAHGHAATDVATNDDLRAAAVAATGVHEPSPATWALVVAHMAHVEGDA